MPDFYTTPQIAAAAGVTERKLISYVERRYVKPSVQEASGHGSRRLWSFFDAVRCRAITQLLTFLSVEAVRELAPLLATDDLVSSDLTWNITRDREGTLRVGPYTFDLAGNVRNYPDRPGPKTLYENVTHQDFFLTLSFGMIHRQVDRTLSALPDPAQQDPGLLSAIGKAVGGKG